MIGKCETQSVSARLPVLGHPLHLAKFKAIPGRSRCKKPRTCLDLAEVRPILLARGSKVLAPGTCSTLLVPARRTLCRRQALRPARPPRTSSTWALSHLPRQASLSLCRRIARRLRSQPRGCWRRRRSCRTMAVLVCYVSALAPPPAKVQERVQISNGARQHSRWCLWGYRDHPLER